MNSSWPLPCRPLVAHRCKYTFRVLTHSSWAHRKFSSICLNPSFGGKLLKKGGKWNRSCRGTAGLLADRVTQMSTVSFPLRKLLVAGCHVIPLPNPAKMSTVMCSPLPGKRHPSSSVSSNWTSTTSTSPGVSPSLLLNPAWASTAGEQGESQRGATCAP